MTELIDLLKNFSWILSGMESSNLTLICVLVAVFFAYIGAPFIVWVLFSGSLLFLLDISDSIVWNVFTVVSVMFLPTVFRRVFISFPLMKLLMNLKLLPQISQTEKEAIDAGTVWVDKDLFSGAPDFQSIMAENYPKLSRLEKQFLTNQVETVCNMIDDWSVYKKRDLPPKVWQYLKQEKFFGMGIPRKFGGLGFSAFAHSCVIAKLASRSITLAITVMVPNSLGPGELLTHFGTKKQKSHYLPRLADGLEIPCFALTEPTAGSDAGSLQASGDLFKGDDGKLYIKLNWNKRWITLAAISTVIGVAFKLRDPKNLLGKGDDLGITCALIPSDTDGVVLGKRHDPLGIPFYNCPTHGKNVIVSIDTIIGGPDQVGNGWRMLMESLSAGRGISLPANSVGGGWLVSRSVGAFSVIRKQFGTSIGQFEGVQEALARIAGYTYLMDAMRTFTCGALDSGSKPAVITAIAKYHATELFRSVINDGMDVMGGAGITMGKRNLLAQPYIAAPIGITVEGANILTRTLMIFGQGAIRCHPYVLDQIEALETGNYRQFDKAFFSHVKHVVRNLVRTIVLTLTRGLLSCAAPSCFTSFKRSYQKLAWASAMFAFFADIALGTLGGALKRKEALTGRFADIFSWMYMATSVLRKYRADGEPHTDKAIVQWSLETAFYNIQTSFESICREMSILRPFSLLLRLFPFGSPPSDSLMSQVALGIQQPSEHRDRLTDGLFIPESEKETVKKFDRVLHDLETIQPILSKIKKAMKEKVIEKDSIINSLPSAQNAKVITANEQKKVEKIEKDRLDCIQVDSIKLDSYLAHKTQ